MINTNKKTVLYLITQSELGGAQRYVFDLVKNLKEEYNIAVAFGEQGESGEIAEKLKKENIDIYTAPHLKREINLMNDFRAFLEIKKIIKKIKPDIVHLNSSKISVLGSLAAKMRRVPKIIYTAHGWVFQEPLPKNKKRLYIRAEKFTSKWKHKIICVSETDRLAGIETLSISPKKLITIHNGISEIKFFGKNEARTKINSFIKNDIKINEDDIIVGSIGNLYKTKGFDYLINAVKIIVNNGLNIKLVIIGEGEERKELEKWIEQLNLEKNVILAGRIDNARELLLAFDFYVCSSVKEGLSYTVMEAMQAGLPIVATRVGGNTELIEDGKEGIIAGPGDAEKIANGLARLFGLIKEKPEIVKNAREKALKEFGLEKMVKETRNVYEEK